MALEGRAALVSGLQAALKAMAEPYRAMPTPEGFVYSSVYDYVVRTGTVPPLGRIPLDEKRRLWGFVQKVQPEIKQCFAQK